MELKELREKAGLKQSELAAISGVNLRSLQDYEQGHKSLLSAKGETLLRLGMSLGCTVEDILGGTWVEFENNGSNHVLLTNRIYAYEKGMEKRKAGEVTFPIVVADDLVDMSRIYPTKQRVVKRVLSELRSDGRVSSLRLFGSSITMACNKDSDVDFAVGLNEVTNEAKNEISEIIQIACDWGADIIWMDRLSKEDYLYKAVMRGVIII